MDYFARPELTVYNAIPTAEGCIGILLAERTRTLWGTNLLLLGFGPVGQALGARLAALGANVTVCAGAPNSVRWPRALVCGVQSLPGWSAAGSGL